jgi:alanine-glyoxylate transaminase / serine-glyoxylate transaminase / serine-pyruvate transaminase
VKYLLMTPGPVEVPDEVLDAFQGQPVAHYGKEFRDLYLDTTKRLSRILGTEGKSYLMPGSGSTALESIGATFCNSKKCLVLNNGTFGDRLFDISSKYASEVKNQKFSLGEPIDLDITKKLISEDAYDVVLMTHVDTSVGILNPVEAVSKIAKESGSQIFIDAIASSGLENIEMDKWMIDGIMNASQKGFACPAGLGMVTVQNGLLDSLKDLPEQRSWYPDLRTWEDYYGKWNDWHPYPSTLPTNTVNAVAKSLEMIEKEGIGERIGKLKEVSGRFRKAIRILGLDTFIPDGLEAHGLTTVTTLEKFDASECVVYLKKQFGIQVGGSLGKNGSVLFRVGHMSQKQYQVRNLVAVINGIALFMRSKGLEADLGRAVSELIE